MRIIISGGTGLIGRELAADLLTDGHDVTLLSRNPERAKSVPAGAHVARWDARSAAGWGHLVDGVDAIVNLAGESIAGDHFFPARWSATRKQRIRQSRLDAGRAIVEAVRAAKQKPEVVLQASAIGYYGPHAAQHALTEDSPAGNDFMARLCVEWEASSAAVEEMDVRRVVTRSSLVLSANGGVFTRLLLPFKLFAGGPLGNGRQVYSWIHIADQIAAIRYLIENKTARGVYNLAAPHALTNGELAKAIGRVLKRPSFIPVPAFAMRLMFGEVATGVLEGQRVLPQRLQEAHFTFRFPQIEPALRDLLKR